MIPSNLVPGTKNLAEEALTPLQPVRELRDVLANLQPGQQARAEITAFLANGTYRAIIAQREVVLSLPFAAKPGDTLDLVVVENQGRLALALAGRPGNPPAAAKDAATTTLSTTGQLISALLGGGAAGEGGAPAATLNGGKPIAPAPPQSGRELTPLLQKVVIDSGMFYEAHQAAWIGGGVSKESLLHEPQGKLPPSPAGNPGIPAGDGKAMPGHADAKAGEGSEAPATAPKLAPAAVNARAVEVAANPNLTASTGTTAPETLARGTAPAASIPPEIAPLVQQQLTALATNVFAWQGMAWPGQAMQWEIVDERGPRGGDAERGEPSPWQTRLHLSMPSLGALDAVIELRGDAIAVEISAASEDARRILSSGGERLRRQFEAAGLKLTTLGVQPK